MTLLVAMPLSWALFSFGKIGPARGSEPATAAASTVHPAASEADDTPVVTIGLMVAEPSSAPAASEPEAPMVAPAGYLLPDNGPEETVHAGP